MTYNHERQQFAQDRAKLSDFAGRRVEILSANLNSLTAEIEQIETIAETKRIVQYTLRNLAKDAELSVRDIEDMGRVEETSAAEPAGPQLLPIPDDAPPREGLGSISPSQELAQSSEEAITFNCARCGVSNSTTMSLSAGATKHAVCTSCEARVIVHRMAAGKYRVVDPSRGRLSNVAAASRPVTYNLPITVEEPAETHGSYACPRCQNRITYLVRQNQRTVERPCFSCFAVSEYDRVLRTAKLMHERKPVYLETLHAEEMDCVNCGRVFSPKIYHNEEGREVACCFSCNTIYRPKSELKRVVEKPCATENCSGTVAFKVSDTDVESRQFCFECLTRQLLRIEEDTVSVIEVLSVPRISLVEFAADGNKCPHCREITSGRYKMNTKGQRLSICWHCKNIFEIERDALPPKLLPQRRDGPAAE